MIDIERVYDLYLQTEEAIYKKKHNADKKKIRASSAGYCYKKQWYLLQGTEGTPLDPKSRRLLRLGTIVHKDLETAVKLHNSNQQPQNKIKITAEHKVKIDDLNLVGTADLVVYDRENDRAKVYDYKTAHSFKWKMMFGRNKSGNPKRPSRNYELQVGTYGLGIAKEFELDEQDIELSLVYYKKDDSLMREVSVKNIWMHNASDYWMDLNETLDEVDDVSDMPRESTNCPVESWECRYCQFETICK